MAVAVDSGGNVFIDDGDSTLVELQRTSVNFEGVNVCAPGQTTPAPCSQTLTLNFNVTASGTLGTPKALTGGVPNLDFTLARGSTCTGEVTVGAACTVNVTFTPRFAGSRQGAVQIVDDSGNVLATTLIYGVGVGPQIAFEPGTQIELPLVEPIVSGNVLVSAGVDSAGDLFVTNLYSTAITEIPYGGGPSFTLPYNELTRPQTPGIDGAGDVFMVENGQPGILEFAGGVGAPSTLLPDVYILDLVIDGQGDLVFSIPSTAQIDELPAGGGPQFTLPFSGLGSNTGAAMDANGDVFVADTFNDRVLELPAGATQTITLPFSGLNSPAGIAVDAAGDVFVGDINNSRLVELPNGGSQQVVLTGLGYPSYVLIDPAGDIFVAQNTEDRLVELQRSQSAPVNFGIIPYGSTATLPLTVSNIGNAPLTMTPSINGPSYQVTNSTCGDGVAPGASCTLQVEFNPVAVGNHDDHLTLTPSSGVVPPRVGLHGAASGVGVEAEGPLAFGTIPFGTTEVLLLTINNIGVAGTVTIGTQINGPSYKILTTSQNTCLAGINAGQSCTLPVEFDPVSVGNHNDYLILTPSSGAPSRVNLQGTAD